MLQNEKIEAAEVNLRTYDGYYSSGFFKFVGGLSLLQAHQT